VSAVIVDERRYAAVIGDLAPAGVVRVAINYGNSVLAQRSGDNTLRGVSVDLALEAGRQLMRPVELVPYAAAGQVVADIDQGSWDVACLAIERFARQESGLRALRPSFLAIEQALGVPRQRPAGNAWLAHFIERMKASGFVAESLAASGQTDAVVAPQRKSLNSY
jgi:hypothetical protein